MSKREGIDARLDVIASEAFAQKRQAIDEMRAELGVTASEVFAQRLRERRKDRGFNQTELASLMTEEGHTMSRAALARIESGERRLTLDEALGFADVLGAVPLQMLSPDEGKMLFSTNYRGLDGSGLRSWMRFGNPHEETFGPAAKARRLDREVAVHARALVDAHRSNDKAGVIEAVDAILEVARREGIAE